MSSKYLEIEIEKIELDLENPRIKQFLEIYTGEITSEQIALALTNPGSGDSTTSYNILKESIKVQKGIIHPIIVNEKDDRYVVIEGNTRLQIYREFKEVDPNGPWNKIRCIVYNNLDRSEIHAIRLQSHLVGPRDWDAYSKAKYLNELSNIEHLPMSNIISMCGGNATEINLFISAYTDMQKYFAPLYDDGELPTREFSKFVELQKKSIKSTLAIKGFGINDFSKWVYDGNIDTAQNVRQLPQVLKNQEAFEEFKSSNLSSAIKKLAVVTAVDGSIKSCPYEVLGSEFLNRLKEFEWSEVKKLRLDHELDHDHELKRNLLYELGNVLNDLLDEIGEEE